ncbi:MAG: SUMF1/EgtB/PvdO family nonheme iron enzyme, partial [Opitutales bacterium]
MGGGTLTCQMGRRISVDLHRDMTPPPLEIDTGMRYGAGVVRDLRATGDRLGRFDVVERLAVTLLGALYRVRTRPAGELRLLQVLPAALSREPAVKQRLQEAVSRLQGLSSSLVLVPEEVVECDGLTALVYPHREGKTLARLRAADADGLQGQSPRVRTLLGRVAEAIDLAAAFGVHHYALTPEMMLMARNGEPCVWGFGVLAAIERRQFEIFVSSAIVPLKDGRLTPDYTVLDALSPEWRNGEAVDIRSDLYGLGLLGHNLLTGQRLAVQPVMPAAAGLSVARGWDLFLLRLLAPAASERYQTLEAARSDLERVEHLHEVVPPKKAIDRIPLPSRFTRVSSRFRTRLRYIIFAALLLSGTVTAGLLAMVLMADPVAPTPDITRAGDASPNLVLEISPAAAQVHFFGEGGARFVTHDGRLALRGKPRDYLVTVSAPRHETTKFRVDLTAERLTRRVELDLAFGLLRLQAPAGSLLEQEGEGGARTFLAEVPPSGTVELADRLFAETYTLVVGGPGFTEQRFAGVALRADEWTELKAALEPLPATLEVLSSPSGALVRLAGKPVGRTPLRLEGLSAAEPVRLVVGGGTHRAQVNELTLRGGELNRFDAGQLEVARGTVALSVHLAGRVPSASQLPGLQIRLGDRDLTGRASFKAQCPVGSILLRAEHPDFFPAESLVEVADGESTRLDLDLLPRPARVALRVPAVDGLYQLFAGDKELSLENGEVVLPAGVSTTIELRSEVFLPARATFQPGPNERLTWEPALERLPPPATGERYTVPHLDLALVWAPAGEFMMGSPLREPARLPNEGERTRVTLSSGFWIGATEVTQASFTALMGHNPSVHRGAHLPVDAITWAQAVTFCERLTARETRAGRLPPGYVYRLPTEAEWEYAARAGTTTPFAFGRAADGSEAHFSGRYPRAYESVETAAHTAPVPVGSHRPNPWGLHDVHGNVREWTADTYNDRLPGGTVTDFVRSGEGRGHPVRGGSWADRPAACRSA